MPKPRFNNKKKDEFADKFRVNNDIHISGNVRIIGENIESKIVSINEARNLANSMEMDIVEVKSNSELPIIRICHYDKMIYELKRNAKKNKAQTKPLKEIQLRVNIAQHDLETKANHARKFLEDGSRVKVILMMRGRELSRREENKKSILELIVMLEDIATIESAPRDEGNKTIVYLKKKK